MVWRCGGDGGWEVVGGLARYVGKLRGVRSEVMDDVIERSEQVLDSWSPYG